MLFNQAQIAGAGVLKMGVFRKRIYDPSGPYTTNSGKGIVWTIIGGLTTESTGKVGLSAYQNRSELPWTGWGR